MIRINGINKTYGNLKVLNDINLNWNKGQCVGLLGSNGSGKTTLIKILLGLVVPDKGEVFVGKQNIKHGSSYRNIMGYMPQIGRYPENMNILQLFDLMKDIRGKGEGELDRALYFEYRLDELGQKLLGSLSGGTRQKVSAAIAFLFDPEVIILDEPTAGLDPLAALQLKRKIEDYILKGKLVIITSHILSELEALVTDVVFLQDGEVFFNGNKEELFRSTQQNSLNEAIALLMKNGIAC